MSGKVWSEDRFWVRVRGRVWFIHFLTIIEKNLYKPRAMSFKNRA